MKDTKAIKHINHNKEEIQEYLNLFKKLVEKRKFYICTNRDKNKKFIEIYNINSNKQRKMLLEINVEDFCYSVDDEKDLSEKLFIFSKDYILDNWGDQEIVPVYIKISIKEDKDEKFSVIISFHKREKSIKKLFC